MPSSRPCAAGRTSISYKPTGLFVSLEADLDGDGVFEALGGDEVVLRTARLPKRASLRIRVQGGSGSRVIVYSSPGRSATPLATFNPTSANETYLVPISELAGTHSWWRVEVRAPGPVSGRDADPTLPDQLRAATSPVFVSVATPAAPQPEIALPTASGHDQALPVLGEQGEFSGFAAVAVADGVTHIVAERHADHEHAVVYRRLKGHGKDEVTVQLSTKSHSARSPQVVASGKNVWVVWQDEDGELPHRPVILLRHSSNGGHAFGPAVQLSDGKGRAVHPAVALLNNQHPVVAWADNSNGAFDVLVQVVGVDKVAANITAAGKVIAMGSPDDARSPRYPASLFPSVTVGRDRRIVVVWQDNRYDADPLWTGHTPCGRPVPQRQHGPGQLADHVRRTAVQRQDLGRADSRRRHHHGRPPPERCHRAGRRDRGDLGDQGASEFRRQPVAEGGQFLRRLHLVGARVGRAGPRCDEPTTATRSGSGRLTARGLVRLSLGRLAVEDLHLAVRPHSRLDLGHSALPGGQRHLACREPRGCGLHERSSGRAAPT